MPRLILLGLLAALLGVAVFVALRGRSSGQAAKVDAPATKPQERDPGLPVSFLGINSKANRIAFVSDNSGSMMVKFDVLRVGLRNAVDGLRPPQSFQVIFMAATTCRPVDPKGMLLATPENKRKAFDLIDKISPTGSTDPIPALDLAFKQGAELIYLLTDGDFPDNKATVDEIHRLNPGKLVRINTIAFMDHDEGYENLLHKIADENGGAFRFFSEDEAERDMAK